MAKVRPLSLALQKRAMQDLDEVPTRVLKDIETLRSWIEMQPHLRARTDDQFLIGFLRGCKFSLEKAKHKIDFFYAIRKSVPELYQNRFIDDKTLEIHRSGVFLRLPEPISEDGPRIQFLRYGQYDTNKFKMADIMKVNSIVAEIQLNEDDNQMVAGFIEIMDFSGITLNTVLQFDASLTKKMVLMSDKAWPNRPKGFHIINAPKSGERVLNFVMSILSDKLKERFHVHSNLESLYEYVPKECLPAEYGGSNGTINEVLNTWEKKLLSYKQYFEEDAKYGTDENLRKNSEKFNAESILGVQGSFRKLDID